jgi:hypothetical protein
MSTKLKAGTATSGAVIDADTTGILELQSGSTPTTAVTVDASQNVGIGTSSPGGRLQLTTSGGAENALRMTGSTTAASYIQFNNSGGNFYVGLDNSTGSSFGATYSANLYMAGAYPMLFWTSGNERMRIDSTGNLLVGTGSASGKLTVSGGGNTIYATQATASSYTTIFNSLNQSGTYYLTAWQAAGTTVGSVTSNGTTTSYGTSSDYRLKDNVVPMQNALNVVQQLKPVTYKWKSDGSDGQGFIAHELQAVVPDCVVGEKDGIDAEGNPKYQNIDTSYLIATLTAAIQEQQALITDLTTRLSALEAK